MAYYPPVLTRRRSTPEELDDAFKRAIKALSGSSVLITKRSVAMRAHNYVPESPPILEQKLNAMDELKLRGLGIPDPTARSRTAASGVNLLKSLHWRARKQTRPPSSF